MRRKTGITLPDKGVRDEHGLEPVSGIFSSPMASPARNDATMSSSEMHVQDSSAPEVEQTLHMRKTPKLPPPRASTPRHTHIGSPKRMSASRPYTTGKPLPVEDAEEGASPTQAKTQPPANRKLDFTGEGAVRKSIESLSPFKPRKTLRRSMGPQQSRSGVFDSPAKSEKRKSMVTEREDSTVHESDDGEAPEPTVVGETTVNQTEQQTEQQSETQEDEQQTELPQAEDDGPIIMDGDDGYQTTYDDPIPDEEAGAEQEQSSPSGRRASRPRKSIESVKDTIVEPSPSTAKATPPSRKRNRASMESQHTEAAADGTTVQEDQSSIHQEPSVVASPAHKKPRGRPRKEKVVVHHEDGDEAIDPQLLAHGDQYTADEQLQQRLKDVKKSKPGAPKERDPNRSMRAATSPVRNQRASIDPSVKSPNKRPASRGGSMGPVSNVNLRATTPFEDAGSNVTRSGRPVYKPLQYWANETRVWRHGQVEGIVRAEEVEKPKPKKGKKRGRKPKNKANGTTSKLDDIEEESETESTFADEWEDSVGVIAGSVAAYDPLTGTGSNSLPAVREDLAFASSSIVTRDVAGSEFKYAKIMTLPFFGSGLVELPPEGFKRAKNSRKMQMCFFVHEGKVMVEIGAGGGGEGGEVNQFAISKGGVWVVPRGESFFFFSFFFRGLRSCSVHVLLFFVIFLAYAESGNTSVWGDKRG